MVETLVEEIRSLAKNYIPGEEIARDLGRKAIVPVVGPPVVGKNTIMAAACKQEPEDFHKVISFTTRPQEERDTPDTYHFLAHTVENLQRIKQKIAERALVQVAIHPTTGYIYGSEPQEYPAAYNLIDTLSGAVDSMRRLPFGHCATISVSTQPAMWQEWFFGRYETPDDHQEARRRLDEADQSIGWSLQDAHTFWLNNSPLNAESSGATLIKMARGDIGSDPTARTNATFMQKRIPSMKDIVLERAA
jgi:guanylate kinase